MRKPIKIHKHSQIVDLIGRDLLITHFTCSLRTVQIWQAQGIPPARHRSVLLLALQHNIDLGDLKCLIS